MSNYAFILSSPRSGSSLLASMLNKNIEVKALPETWIFWSYAKKKIIINESHFQKIPWTDENNKLRLNEFSNPKDVLEVLMEDNKNDKLKVLVEKSPPIFSKSAKYLNFFQILN